MPFDGTEINDPLLRVLEGTRALLARPEGWTQWAEKIWVSTGDGRHQEAYCLLGAQKAAKAALCEDRIRFAALARALGFSSVYRMTRWNDSPRRRKHEVLARLDAAIERRRAEVLARVG